MNVTPPMNPDDLADALTALREHTPLVQCLTNIVVAEWTANVLLAVGAAPAMVDNPQEAGRFAAMAGGVLVNLGTPYDETARAMHLAVAGAKLLKTPWVLDPVAAGVLPWRTQLAHQLLRESRPTIIRGNASEILALAGGAGGRGVESVDSPEEAVDVARVLAKQQQSVIAISGPTDHITDGERLVRLSNGHPWLTSRTGDRDADRGCRIGSPAGARSWQLCGRPAGRAVAAAARGPGRAGEDHLRMDRPLLDLSLYLVTDTILCGQFGVAATVSAAVGAGVTLVQLRDIDAADDELVALGREVKAILRGTGVPLIVNDRAHLVAAIGADGVHVGQSDLEIAQARALVGPTA